LPSPNKIKTKLLITALSKTIAIVSFITYFVLLLLETLQAGFTSNYLNINVFIWSGFISSFVFILFGEGFEEKSSKSFKPLNAVSLVIIGLIGLFILLNTTSLGYISILIAISSFIVLFLFFKTLKNI
jgi:hypothetical protein